MKTKHDVKKSSEPNSFIDMRLMLKILCFFAPLIAIFCQIWLTISNSAVLAYARIKLTLMRQDESLILLLLLRLLYITLYCILEDLAFIGLVTVICVAYPVKFLLHFYVIRHRRILWTGAKILLRMVAAVTYHLLMHEEIFFPLVRLALLVLTCIAANLFYIVCVDILACDVCNSHRITVFVGNPAFGGRGPGVRLNKKRGCGNDKEFDSTLGFPGEG